MTDASSIIVLGGPAAGKTVYLSVLYHHLWNGHNGMVMRAGSGTMHSELLKATETLRRGTMPPATQALRHYEFELEHGGRLYHLQYLDYPGEVFRKAFFEMSIDTDETRELMRICDSAAGVIILVDPKTIVENGDELDFALSNLFRYYGSRTHKPQFTFALTKRDETEGIVGDHIASFLKRHLPHVARMLGTGMRIMHFSSIVRSSNTVQLARAEAVKKPIEAILEAVEEARIDGARQVFYRRLAVRRSIGRALVFLGLFVAALLTFGAGAWVRHIVEKHRTVTPLVEDVG